MESCLHSLQKGELDAKKFSEASKKGDFLVNEIVDEAAEYLGIGIDALIKLFNT